MPKCLICGYVAKSIQPHLKFTHSMKVSEYYEAYNAPVYDYNPADRLQKWAKEHPEEYKKKQADSGRKSVVKMNQYLSEHPEVRVEIARKGGFTTGSKNLKTWHQETDPEIVSEVCAKAGHKSRLSRDHDEMARIALQNNRYCKYPYESIKFGIKRKFASQWEVNFIKLCETVKEIHNLVHEPFGIPYVTDKPHKYYPDFLINDTILIEIKPEGKLSDKDVTSKKMVAGSFCQINPQYTYLILTEKVLPSLRNGEITTSAQQKLKEFLKI